MLLDIRPMAEADLPGVIRIDQASLVPSWSENFWRGELLSAAGRYLTALSEGQVIGFAGAQLVLEEAHITTLAVDPACRRRGVGSSLLKRLLERLEGEGASRITLEVRAGNQAALQLYERAGFTRISRRAAYYQDTGEDAVVMWRRSGEPAR